MKATSDRVLTAIFCDDIRHEVGNKMSFMGCYQGELFLPSAPIALAKFCVYVTLITPIGRPVRSLVFKVLQDDDKELARIELPDEALRNSNFVVEGLATRAGLNAAMVFSPFVIEKSTILRVLAITEEGEVVGPRLLVKVQPQMEAALLTAVEVKQAKPAAQKTAPKKSTARKPAKK
jgi:hypothetical protein